MRATAAGRCSQVPCACSASPSFSWPRPWAQTIWSGDRHLTTWGLLLFAVGATFLFVAFHLGARRRALQTADGAGADAGRDRCARPDLARIRRRRNRFDRGGVAVPPLVALAGVARVGRVRHAVCRRGGDGRRHFPLRRVGPYLRAAHGTRVVAEIAIHPVWRGKRPARRLHPRRPV